MATIHENTKGFKIIKCKRREIIEVFGGKGICDSCGKPSIEGYYIAVLNQWFCPQCYKEWYEDAYNYAIESSDDRRVEDKNFNFYGQRPGLI